MCEMQKLRLSLEQILTAAAEEIFGVFKRSIAEIEEKLGDSSKHNRRNQRLPDNVHQTDILIPTEQQGFFPHVDQEDPEPPHIKEEQEEEWISQGGETTLKLLLLSECPTLIQKQWMVKEEPPLEQQDRSPSRNQMDPESSHTKEKNLWTNEDREWLQGLEEADLTKFPSTLPRVKSEYDEDKPQSSQRYQSRTEQNTEEPEYGDNRGKSEPGRMQNNDFPIRDVACQTLHHYTENDKAYPLLSVLNSQVTTYPTERPFTCSVCHKCFVKKKTLNRHMTIHSRDRPFTCSICEKSFRRNCHLKDHMSVHTGAKPFSCSVCNKCFSRKSEVKQHMTVHTGEKPHSCSVCNKAFAHRQNLNKHFYTHIGKLASIH